jgi:5-methylcytosine-specific restriction endonuclease McrA
MTVKQCKRCETQKPAADFYPHKQTKDKLDTVCKPCKKELAIEWARKNPEKNRQKTKSYNERHPDRRKETNKKYYQSNASEIRDRVKASMAKNPELYAELGRKHANRRRARKFENGIEPYTEAELLETYGTACHLCGTQVDLKAPRQVGAPGWELGLHVDHLVPLSKGGADKLENVRPAHGQCNLTKGNTV